MKYPVVLQHSEEDCGAACLASVAQYYGRTFTLPHLREASGTNQQGTTLLGLQQGAVAVGFNARPVRAAANILDEIDQVPLPLIIHWKGYHWVVLYGYQRQKYIIADPAVGILQLSKEELTAGWNDWVCLLIEPDQERFFLQTSDQVTHLWRWIKRSWIYRQILTEVLAINIVLGLLSLGSPFLIQIITDEVLVREDLQLLQSIIIAVVMINLFSSALGLVQSNLIVHFAKRLELGLVMEFGRKMLHLPLSYYETHRGGDIVSRLKDIQELNQFISQFIVSLPSQLLVAIISLMVMLIYSVPLTILAMIIGGLMVLSTLVLLPTLRQKTRNLFAVEAETQGVLVETFKGSLTLKTTNSTAQFWEELQTRFGRQANLAFRTTQIGILNEMFSGFVSGVGGVALLGFGSRIVMTNTLSIGQLLAFLTLQRNVTLFVNSIVRFTDDLTRVQTVTQRLADVIDAPSESLETDKKPSAYIPPNADITCHNITFHYGGQVNLLDKFSVVFPGGKTIALIGRSGCGKSTLAKLIAGLYPLQSGNIRLGIYNQQDLSLDCLRQQVVLVPQDAHFWSRSIIENFQLGHPGIPFEAIVQACQIAGADEFISQLPEKYQTVLGEFGASISGGQRQRLAIARAIVTNPSILILDESTASLDPLSESEILYRLLQQRQGKTTILISHRPRVINQADWIILLDEGQLKLQGELSKLQSLPGEHLPFLTP
ncbi:MAG: peptidase domain-containing ABC transporter [Limnoraphis robusta]|uniref:ABC transporter ATP-binding protein n=1 Tax=Limnoraphis robusta CS-951 TaxID=1637645 RepID=A0A0F5YHV6_9CYAN|nr:peptidase domain-containing ABC transporter [Limnoraphis robusta]KKD38338.1 ABC transporter ATP-binding protein [Limnoraphis robusta CS-951]KMW70633.1 ABC transporter ATP-binding protein [Limnoraphis robusta CS-951]